MQLQRSVAMAPNQSVCMFCLNETNDGFSTYGSLAIAESARQIISNHFWLEVSSNSVIISSNFHDSDGSAWYFCVLVL